MTKLSVLEDAKVKIAAYDEIPMIYPSAEIIQDLVNIIKGLVAELESSDHIFANFSQEIYFSSNRDRFVVGRNAYERISKGHYPWNDAGYKYYGLLSSYDQVEIFLSGREAECLS